MRLQGFFITGFESRSDEVLRLLQLACAQASDAERLFSIDKLSPEKTGDDREPGGQAKASIENAAFVIVDISSRPPDSNGWSLNVFLEYGIAIANNVPTRRIRDAARMSRNQVPSDIPEIVFEYLMSQPDQLIEQTATWLTQKQSAMSARSDSSPCRTSLIEAARELSRWEPEDVVRFGPVIQTLSQRVSTFAANVRRFREKQEPSFRFEPRTASEMIDEAFVGCVRAMRPGDSYFAATTPYFAARMLTAEQSEFHRLLQKAWKTQNVRVKRIFLFTKDIDNATKRVFDEHIKLARHENYDVRFVMPDDYQACVYKYHRGIFRYDVRGSTFLLDIWPHYERENLRALHIQRDAERELDLLTSKWETRGKPDWRDWLPEEGGVGVGEGPVHS